jgi:hypothetical protein
VNKMTSESANGHMPRILAPRFLGAALAGAAVIALGATAMAAQPQVQRIRGTIASVNGHGLTISPYDSGKTEVMLTSGTKYAWVVRSSLSRVRKGDFIGTAATGPMNHMTAQEVVIFPASMKGAGEGHYAWSMPAAVARNDAGGNAGGSSAGGSPVQGTMTNGTVSSTSQTSGARPMQGTMTNGTVSHTHSQSGGRTLTISYSNGQTVQVNVPPNVPIVRFRSASKSIVKQGEKAFIVASVGNGKPEAKFVAVGKNGLMPPM